jgi:hypothetical protein
VSEKGKVAIKEEDGIDPSYTVTVLMGPEKLHFAGEGECIVIV